MAQLEWTACDASANVHCDRCGRLIRVRINFVEGQQVCNGCAVPFGSGLRQPEGFNPPPLELRSPEPKKGQML